MTVTRKDSRTTGPVSVFQVLFGKNKEKLPGGPEDPQTALPGGQKRLFEALPVVRFQNGQRIMNQR